MPNWDDLVHSNRAQHIRDDEWCRSICRAKRAGATYRGIAKHLGISVPQVSQMARRGRKRFGGLTIAEDMLGVKKGPQHVRSRSRWDDLNPDQAAEIKKDEKCRAIARAKEAGATYKEIAKHLGTTAQRVSQMARRAKWTIKGETVAERAIAPRQSVISPFPVVVSARLKEGPWQPPPRSAVTVQAWFLIKDD